MTIRAAIYARYSSALQSDRSIEDQVELCRAHAKREGMQIVGVYEDRARSGASVAGREGLERLRADAAAGRFDTIVMESLDRLSRDMEGLGAVFKRLTHHGVTITQVHGGVADVVDIGVAGLMGSIFLKQLSEKTRRGLAGVFRDGRNAGGKSYGYRTVPGKPGELVIDEDEANVVRRICADYLAGETPRAIAVALNAQGIRPPRGERWNASTVAGSKSRGVGILRNPLYAGRRVWNQLRYVKDPDTGKRISRFNPKDQVQTLDVPALAIVDAATWQRVQDRLEQRGHQKPEHGRKPKRLLSGILRCGQCGGGLSACGGKSLRVRCSRHYESGTCDNRRTYALAPIEQRVIDALRDHLRDPQLIAVYVAEYRAEHKRRAAEARTETTAMQRRLAELGREIDRGTDALLKGVVSAEILGPKVAALDAERKALQARLAAAEGPEVIELHPAAVGLYLAQIERLAETLHAESAEAAASRGSVRELIEAVTVHAGESGQEIEITGRLTALLGPAILPQGRLATLGFGNGGCGGQI